MTTPTIPSPADMPRAGLSRTELLRRQEAAQDAAHALLAGASPVPPELLAPPGELERLAAEQGIQPVTDIDDLAAPLRDRLTDEQFEGLQAALHEPYETPAQSAPKPGTPTPPDDERTSGRAAMGLNRYQEIRDRALSHALRRYELDDQAAMDDDKVIATADQFADWIRRGYHL